MYFQSLGFISESALDENFYLRFLKTVWKQIAILIFSFL